MAEKLGLILKGIQIPDHVLASLQESLANDQEQAENAITAQRNALQPRLAAERRRIDEAYQDKLDGKIPEDFWERKMTEWTREERGIQDALTRLDQPTDNRLLTAQRTLELANKAYSLYLTRNPHEQAQLLRMVLLNCAIDGATVQPTYRKPFDVIFERAVDAVKRFQKRHGLTSNGYLTVDTVEQLNVPLRSRVEQLRLTLERYRWLRYSFTQPPVVVNLPEYRLRAFDRDGRVGLAMNVNVGDAYDFQTPVFESSIRYLVFRPYWNVPPRILRNEVIPDTAEDRSYIVDNDMEVTTLAGQVVASGPISDSVLQQLRAGKLTVRQKPGPENALGLVKIIFPNEHHVYLHHTPESVDMFSQEHRALSHGCIHLQEPAELAAWLLKDKPEWNLERVERAMHEGRNNFTVNLTKPVPILIVYGTAIVEENGEVHFYRDIYGHDAALEAALAKGYPYPK
jgi:murein L,D-transpeptidase YcbB/YkuD